LKYRASAGVLSAIVGIFALAGTPSYAGGTANGGVPTELVPETGTPVITPPPPAHQPQPPLCPNGGRWVTVGVQDTAPRTVMSYGFADDCCCGVNEFGVPITVPGGRNTTSIFVCNP
jgi:hypothetical protein